MRELTLKVFEYDELSEQAKGQAVDSLKDVLMFPENWWMDYTDQFFSHNETQYIDFATLEYSLEPRKVFFHHLMVRDESIISSLVNDIEKVLTKVTYIFDGSQTKDSLTTNSVIWSPKEGHSINSTELQKMSSFETQVNGILFEQARIFFKLYEIRQNREFVEESIRNNKLEFFSDGTVYFPQ